MTDPSEPGPDSDSRLAPPTQVHVDRGRSTRIAALDWGGPGPAVVLLHPNGFCAGLYEPLARALRQRARMVAVDLRGHGASSAPPPDPAAYGFPRLAGDVLAVVDHLALQAPAVVGGSLGGAVAIVADQLRPGCWSRMLLAEPVAFPAREELGGEENPMAAVARRRRATFPDAQAAIEAYREREPLSQLAPEALEAYVRWGTTPDPDGVRLACPPEVEATIFEVSGGPEGAAIAWDHLPHLSAPATIVAGEDTFLPDIFAEQAARAGARLVVVPGGHFVLHEDTTRAVDLVERHALG